MLRTCPKTKPQIEAGLLIEYNTAMKLWHWLLWLLVGTSENSWLKLNRHLDRIHLKRYYLLKQIKLFYDLIHQFFFCFVLFISTSLLNPCSRVNVVQNQDKSPMYCRDRQRQAFTCTYMYTYDPFKVEISVCLSNHPLTGVSYWILASPTVLTQHYNRFRQHVNYYLPICRFIVLLI